MSNIIIPSGAGDDEYFFRIPDGRAYVISSDLVSGSIEIHHSVGGVYGVIVQEGVPQVVDANNNRRLVKGPLTGKVVRVGTTAAVAMDKF